VAETVLLPALRERASRPPGRGVPARASRSPLGARGVAVKECPRCGAVADEEAATCPHEGATLVEEHPGSPVVGGRYRLERRLGAGGMGAVYAARHLTLDKVFALKLLLPRAHVPGLADRFRVEAAALGALDHPGIVRVTDFGVDERDGGMPYLVMERLVGTSLAARCAAPASWPLEAAVDVLAGIAAAVDHAHARGILHGDLKPANVMLVRDPDGTERPRVLDFGLARMMSREPQDAAALPGRGALAGTLSYLAPEVLSGDAPSRASDLYAFGVVAFEVLTGSCPFAGEPWDVIRAHREEPPPSMASLRADLPANLDAAIAPALAKDPLARPTNASVVVGALRRALAEARAVAWVRGERPRRLALAAALAAIVGAFSPWIWSTAPLERASLAVLDGQVARLPATEPDPAIVTVAYDEATIAASPRAMSLEADDYARALDGLFAAGARGVGIDLLLPARWRRSRPFTEALLRHGDRITLGVYSTPNGHVVGPEAVSPMVAAALGAERTSALFAFINLEADRDGVVRRARGAFTDAAGRVRPGFAAAALARSGLGAEPAGRFWIDRTTSWRRVPRYSWRELPGLLAAQPEVFRDRLVLLGGDFADAGEDGQRITGDGERVPGLLVHALAASTLRQGARLRDVPGGVALAVVVFGVAGVAALALLARRVMLSGALAGSIVVLLVLASVVLLRRFGLVLDALGPSSSIVAAMLLAVGLRAALPSAPPELEQRAAPPDGRSSPGQFEAFRP